MPDDSLIVLVIQRHHPGWTPPRDTGREWITCRCPYHGDDSPSASVSFRHNAYRCHSCEVKGDAIALIRLIEEVNYRQAFERAQEISPGSYREVPPKPARKSWGGVPEDPGPGVPVDRPRDGRKVPTRIRGRSRYWA